jgi:hypothetical protein
MVSAPLLKGSIERIRGKAVFKAISKGVKMRF